MDRSIQKNGLMNLLTLLVVGGAGWVLARYCQSLSGQAAMLFVGVGALVAAVSWFQMRLEERERLERLELDEVARDKERGALFESSDAELFPAARARQQFERFFVPVFTVGLFFVQIAGAYYLWRWAAELRPLNHSVVMTMFAVFALWLFLLGKYAASLARLEGQRLLRPGAGYLLLCAYLSFIVLVLGVGGVEVGFANADFYLARALAVLLGLIGLETLINLILEIYRPRVKGKVVRPLYESRLVGLLGQPEGLITTLAQALDYQFGFKVSETWFYRFLERALAGLVLFQLAVLLLSTSVVFIEPGEQGLLERFGKPVAGRQVLEPGPHLKFPWPVDRVYRFATAEIQSINVGFEPEADRDKEKTVLWTVPHYKEEFNLLVASREDTEPGDQPRVEQAVPVNLLTVSIPVQFQIADVRAWAYNHQNAGVLLEQLATAEVVRYLVGVDLLEIMSSGRLEAANELKARIQDRAGALKLGVEILFVGLQDIHPPVKVAGDYQAVVGAQQEMEAKILRAEGEAVRIVPMAKAEALQKVREAEADKLRRITSAAALAARFTNQIMAYQASPEVYSQRLYLQTLSKGGGQARKYIVGPTNTHDVIQLNLEDKLRPDLLDVTVPPAQ